MADFITSGLRLNPDERKSQFFLSDDFFSYMVLESASEEQAEAKVIVNQKQLRNKFSRCNFLAITSRIQESLVN